MTYRPHPVKLLSEKIDYLDHISLTICSSTNVTSNCSGSTTWELVDYVVANFWTVSRNIKLFALTRFLSLGCTNSVSRYNMCDIVSNGIMIMFVISQRHKKERVCKLMLEALFTHFLGLLSGLWRSWHRRRRGVGEGFDQNKEFQLNRNGLVPPQTSSTEPLLL